MEYPFVLGTAGHIDHGKTALVKAISGVDCDSLSEEKKRGITIELGFAPLRLVSGKVVSIVDVPGHERFIRQMVAGAAGIDAVMFVVAADEGVMPQTREHLDILKLLGVSCGVIVLTKSDLVSDELLEMAKNDVEELAKGTFLEKAPVIPVSVLTGNGIPDLLDEIEKLVASSPQRDADGAFFMPVDRAFTMRGFGSVVTGTSYQGELSEGDEVDVTPSMLGTKVRSIQVHGAAAKNIVAGQRVAVNLASVSLEQLRRGDAICAKGRFAPTNCLDVSIEMLGTAAEPLFHWQRVRLHIGTADTMARVSLLRHSAGSESAIAPGGHDVAQLITETPIAAAAGQRFVIRFYSPLVTIGGGKVMMTNAGRPQSRDERDERFAILNDLADNWDRAKLLESLVRVRGYVTKQKLFDLSQFSEQSFAKSLGELGEDAASSVAVFGRAKNLFISKKALDAVAATLTSTLSDFHRHHNELSGLGADEMRMALTNASGMPLFEQKDFKELLDLLVAERRISEAGGLGEMKYCMFGFKPAGDKKFMALVKAIREAAESAGFEMVETSDMPSRFGVTSTEVTKAISYLRENEDLRIVGSSMIFPVKTREKALEILMNIKGDITIGSFRDTIGASRKYALAILEFFDSNDVTKRVGDRRVLLKQMRQK